ncbi:DUF4189 domain-containing protein [Nocardia cyriacigeorgica]|uniref:DUF4189 domain-containing protein n=1 Tax=Nocardia cyriacigeorgica TaxID=135487 RepID=UPI002456034E|nr:DUF4189 domain-containing protein [Nocardia cyriacigeorgica]
MKLSITAGILLAGICASTVAAGPVYADAPRWTAVAVSPAYGLLNNAFNYGDPEEAKNVAIANCDRRVPPPTGSSAPVHDCRIVLVFASGQCGAVAVGDRISNGKNVGRTYSYSVGNSITEADIDAVLKNAGRNVTVWWSQCQQ